jgi:hypothetical protein
MILLGTITDPGKVVSAENALNRFLLKFINDERDLPFLKLSFRITVTLLPVGILLFLPGISGLWWWALAALYHYMNNFVYKGPFGLMLHCTSHRALFKRKYNFFNHYIPWVLAPFFGHSPETYYAHHIGMHHAENNMEEDDSSTLHYQRDSLRSFLHYFLRFFVKGVYNLAMYFHVRKRKKLCMRTVRGELLFILMCVLLSIYNPAATICVFILPFVLYRLVAYIGNWAQHAFINNADPANAYYNSVTCINTKYNHKCWNDGYHISHHIKPTMHWTEHPGFFVSTLDDYAKNDAIVFDGIHFLHIWLYLMRRRYDLLAKHFVNVGNRYSSDEEVIAMLKSRTRRL